MPAVETAAEIGFNIASAIISLGTTLGPVGAATLGLGGREAETTVADILANAAKGKQSSSKQFSKPGGFEQANKDFDALTRGSKVTQRGGVRTAELKDGTKVNVRPHSSTGKPTLKIQSPKGQGPTTKVRYH